MFGLFKKKPDPTIVKIPDNVLNIFGKLDDPKAFTFETQYVELVMYTNKWYGHLRNFLQIHRENGKISHSEMKQTLKFFERILPK